MTADTDRPGSGENARRLAVQTGIVYQLVVGLLLLLIIALLAVLWVRERAASMAAQVDLASMRQRQESVEAVLRNVIVGNGERSPIPIRREGLPGRACRLDGREREVLLLDAEQAGRLGFVRGDLILVTDGNPATQPSGPTP